MHSALPRSIVDNHFTSTWTKVSYHYVLTRLAKNAYNLYTISRPRVKLFFLNLTQHTFSIPHVRTCQKRWIKSHGGVPLKRVTNIQRYTSVKIYLAPSLYFVLNCCSLGMNECFFNFFYRLKLGEIRRFCAYLICEKVAAVHLRV